MEAKSHNSFKKEVLYLIKAIDKSSKVKAEN